jgi:predicted MFS family arabinose efflux permease
MVGNVATSSLRQRLVPSRLLGRVSGAGTTIAYGAMPLGALLGGLVAELLGLRALMLAVPGFLVVAVALTVAAFNQRDVAKADADVDADRERMATITG